MKSLFKRLWFIFYRFGLKLGFHVVPESYYLPLANILELEKRREEWAKKSDLPGISADCKEQLKSLKEICLPFEHEYRDNRSYKLAVKEGYGLGFGPIEAKVLHSIIRKHRPSSVIEVGSGVSTLCSLEALKMNKLQYGGDFSLTCIEPYPSQRLSSLKGIELIKNKVELLPLNIFEGLKQGDLLFIDSSHTVKPAGDVNFLILEVLPRLKPGVIVHFHDIFFPYDYQHNLLKTVFQWCETSLLRAFLIHNSKAEIILSLSHLHYEKTRELKELFPEYTPQESINGLDSDKYGPFEYPKEHFPSSIYIRIK